ncbi:MAG: hypothetical protein JEZ08_25540 [Clostridiales bacterium]|nr:hypothetical protein [Clostridiales bacterium]
MHYWNKRNFEGLKNIGEYYSDHPILNGFSEYCLLREIGLRKKALKTMESFIASVKQENISSQRSVVNELVRLKFNNRDVHHLFVRNLSVYVEDVLKKWIIDEDNVIPYRWLGYISKNTTYYEKALLIDPTDRISSIELIRLTLKDLWYQTHHLSESLLLGTTEEAEESLKLIKKIIDDIDDNLIDEKLLYDYNYYLDVIETWKEYKTSNTEVSFPNWSHNRGKLFCFTEAFYYID